MGRRWSIIPLVLGLFAVTTSAQCAVPGSRAGVESTYDSPASMRMAQAGSAGGIIGKQEKSVSGTESQRPGRTEKKARAKSGSRKESSRRRSSDNGSGSVVSLAQYDGGWQFNMTNSCGRPSSQGISIADGMIRGAGGSGRISPNGNVTGSWSFAGLIQARIRGHMTSSSSGGGSWFNNIGCSGRWNISRS